MDKFASYGGARLKAPVPVTSNDRVGGSPIYSQSNPRRTKYSAIQPARPGEAPQGLAVEGELTGGMGIDTPGASWTELGAGPAEGVAIAELLSLAAWGVAASPDAEEGATGVAA